MARLVTALAVAACGLVLSAEGAFAFTAIGQAQDGTTCNGGTGMDTVQTASAGPSYTVPAGNWQITGWSTQASAAVDGNLALEVWRPTATSGTYTLVGISDAQTVVAGSGLNTFTLAQPLPVQPGDLLGLRITGFAGCSTFTANFTGDAYMEALNTPSPSPGSTSAFQFAIHGFELNVAATLTEAAPPPPPTPSTKDDCKDGGWQQLSDGSGTPFKNEGDCVSYVATQGSNTAG